MWQAADSIVQSAACRLKILRLLIVDGDCGLSIEGADRRMWMPIVD
jgi:hypothetical protein